MKVIPVIDILNGDVVHAVRGQRKEYKPLQSILTNVISPLEVAKAFKNLGFTELYIADLDAIISGSTDFSMYKQISIQTGLKLMVDAGITSIDRAQNLFNSGVSKVVVGTETLQRKGFIKYAVKRFGSQRVILSLDLKGEKVMVKLGFDGCATPMCLLREFKSMGLKQVIVLDLTKVGSGAGVNMDFLKRVIAEICVDVYVGGGIRDINDLVELQKIGVFGALVASALHNGKIPIPALKEVDFV